MPKKTRFFRVAVEGATSDGRAIEREWLEQVAQSYDPKVYGARINIEHIRGMSPSSEFRAYGDVLAVKTEEVEIGGKKKLALYAQIDATDELVALNKKRQKLYSSLEIRPNFGDTGGFYLTGLAVTDNPASLGTEMLAFAAQNPDASPFKARKDQPDDLFTVAEPVTLEFEDDESAGILAKFKASLSAAVAKFTGKAGTDDARFEAVADSMQQMGSSFSEHAEKVEGRLSQTGEDVAALRADIEKLQQQYSQLDNTEQSTRRPMASGGDSKLQAEF